MKAMSLWDKRYALNEFNNNGDDYHFGIPHRYSTHYLLLEALREQLKD